MTAKRKMIGVLAVVMGAPLWIPILLLLLACIILALWCIVPLLLLEYAVTGKVRWNSNDET